MPLASPTHILAQHFDTNDIAFKKIDEEIAALQENIRALNAFRNTFTPSYRLPPEILTYIFSLFEKDPILPLRRRVRRGGISRPFTWLVATRVSQHWRNVALGSPGLWTYISNSYPKRVIEELLQRSKAAPLSVHLNHGPSQSVFFIGTSPPRIYDLKLIVDADTWNTFWSNLSSPAPLLESLSLSISDTSQPLPTISNNTFAGTTPSLRRLDLTGCSVDVTSSLFKELTTLRLNCPFEKISATDILTVLRGLPQLTSLALSHVFPENPTTLIPSNFNTVALPKLKSLSINGETYSQDLDFLSYLAVPAYSIQFCSTTESLTEKPLAALTNFLRVYKAARCLDSSPLVLNTLDLYFTYHTLSLVMNNEGAEAPDVVNLLDFELFVPRLEDIFEISANSESTNLFSYLPLSTLTSFTTTCNIHVDVWVKIFGTLPKLKHISVSGTYAFNVFSAIIKDVEAKLLPYDDERVNSERNGDGAKQTMQIEPPSARPVDFMPVFPQLERIELQSATFPEDLFDLIRTLHARNGVGRGVKTLKITECKNVDESTCEALRECVDSVVWDEWAPVSEDDSDEFAMGSESGGD